jgi:predicted transcriptional regulator
MIEELLKTLGFSDKEITVYLAVLKYGRILPASLAQVVGLKRSTVYSIAKELVKRGIITEDLGSVNLHLVAKPPQDLELLAKREQRELEDRKDTIKKAIAELQTIAETTKYAVPKISFIAEDEFNDHLYKQTPAWDESILKYDGIWWGFQDHTFVQHYEAWIDWYWEEGSNPKTSLKLLSNEVAEKIKKKKYARRQIRFWDQSHNFQATTWILGDFVVMIVTSQKPFYLVEIHDAVLAHDLREVFKGIWHTQIQPN